MNDPDHIIPDIDEYINDKTIAVLDDFHIKTVKKNSNIGYMLHYLRSISLNFSDILGLDFTLPMFIDAYNGNDRLHDIMETTFRPDMQPYEIEVELEKLEKEMVSIFKGMRDCPLGVVLRARTGVKTKQLTEFIISEGLKPTLSGKTIPKPIQNSTLIGGLASPSDILISTKAARKSPILNKTEMGRSGYFGKLVALLARTASMSTDILDCGTKHLVCYDVDSKAKLKKLNGKFYKLSKDDEDYKVINYKKDTNLVGKKLYVRSAACCALPGDKICPRCIGMTASTNIDIAEGIGAFEAEEITKKVNQDILSSKHLLTTKSENIVFNDEFFKFFNVYGGEIYPTITNNEEVPNINDYAIFIDPDDVEKIDEMDDDSLFNNMITNGRFYIQNMKDLDDRITIQCENEKEIYISKECTTLMKKNKGYVYFKDLNDEDKLFEIVIENNELTKPLYSIMHLLNRKQGNETITIDEMSNQFLDLLIESGISANVVAAEIIINRLIRSVEHPFDRPDFSQEKLEPYEIIRIHQALERNRSALVGLSSDYLKRQILSDDFFEERTGTSYLDALYKEEIDTSKFQKYEEYFDMEEMKDFIS